MRVHALAFAHINGKSIMSHYVLSHGPNAVFCAHCMVICQYLVFSVARSCGDARASACQVERWTWSSYMKTE